MSRITVTSGILQGRKIPFVNSKFNDADITSQKIKDALFSILGEELSGKSFLDLFSCSGQIGIEAVSRGSDLTVFNEFDKKRYNFIKFLLKDLVIEDNTHIFNYDFNRLLRLLKNRGFTFDIIFLDPPYVKEKTAVPLFSKIFYNIEKNMILKKGGTVILQHFSKNIVNESYGIYKLKDRKKYGTSSLSIYN